MKGAIKPSLINNTARATCLLCWQDEINTTEETTVGVLLQPTLKGHKLVP